jgi:hypothetical protein
MPNAFVAGVNTAIAQSTHDPWTPVTALAAFVNRCDLSIQCGIGHRTFTGFPLSPLAVSGS